MNPLPPMHRIVRMLAAALAALGIALPASAATSSTDFTDLWWNPAENGWGVNLIQQGEIIFATLFVYGPDGSNRWFVASALSPAGGNTFSGTLYQTSGPYFGAAGFDPGAVGLSAVGNMTLSFGTATTGTLTYTVNGVSVTKSVQRQAFRTENLSGNYLGGMIARGPGCNVLAFDTLTVSHSGASVTMTVDFRTASGTAARCTYTSSNYGQFGKMGQMSGSFSCDTGNTGSFSMSAIHANQSGFSGQFSGGDQFCSGMSGYFGGTRDVF